MKCACCRKEATEQREGDWFCAKCLAEIELILKEPPPKKPKPNLDKPGWTIDIPGLVKIKGGFEDDPNNPKLPPPPKYGRLK